MATDWTSPKTSDTHTNELAATRGRDESNARMDYTGDTNIPDGTIRWNKASNRFEIWSAASSAWSELSSKYLINVDQVDGYHAGNASGNVPVSNGNVNSDLNADKLDGQHGTFFQARANHTGTQAPSTISPQGAGSGLNADLLDGLHSSAFLGVSAKAVDSDKLDGLDSSNFNRVIDLTDQVQKRSYRKSVIALCNLDNTDTQRNSWSTGRITFHRRNGLNPDLFVLYSASKKYDTTSMNWAAIISNAFGDSTAIQPCTFTYNGVKYGGIHFYYDASEHKFVIWEGNQTVQGSFEPFGLDYYDTLNNIALNTEVNDSLVIDGADIVKRTRAEFNNNLLWHAGNDGSGSGLDADMVDGYHAGNASGNVPVSNGTLNINLNADLLDGKHLSEIGGGIWDVIIEDQKPSGTHGGKFESGAWRTRTLNTLVYNHGSLASLSNNKFTLPAGTYCIEWDAPAYKVDSHKTRLVNADTLGTVAYGTSEFASADNYGYSRSWGTCVITINDDVAFEIQHRCHCSYIAGFGAASFGTEIYTRVRIKKIG